jgi:hypothetical protein
MNREAFDALKLEQGTIIRLHWFDIYEDSVGDTRKAELGLRQTITMLYEVKQSHDIECIVTSNTIDKDPSQQGWCCTPLALVPQIDVIKRPAKKRAKKA